MIWHIKTHQFIYTSKLVSWIFNFNTKKQSGQQENAWDKVDEEELKADENKVGDIAINDLIVKYNEMFADLDSPVQIMTEIKSVKQAEICSNEYLTFKKLDNTRYDRKKKTAFDFVVRFEAAVRQYRIYSNDGVLSRGQEVYTRSGIIKLCRKVRTWGNRALWHTWEGCFTGRTKAC